MLSGWNMEKLKRKEKPENVVNHFLDTVPVPEKVENPEIGAPEVRMDDVKKHYYSIERGVVKAVDGIDFSHKQGRNLWYCRFKWCWKNNTY